MKLRYRVPCTVAYDNTTRAHEGFSLSPPVSRLVSLSVLNGARRRQKRSRDSKSPRARNVCIPGRDDLPPRPVIGQSWGWPRFTGITQQFSRPLKSLRARSRRRFRSLISTRCREIPPLFECAPACKCPYVYTPIIIYQRRIESGGTTSRRCPDRSGIRSGVLLFIDCGGERRRA